MIHKIEGIPILTKLNLSKNLSKQGTPRNQSNTKLGQISSKKDTDQSRFLEALLVRQADGELKNK